MTTLITAEDILRQRRTEAAAGRLAHSAKVDGSFMARMDCPCYTCRDVLDPTGEIDAARANAPPSLPPPAPRLTRQNANCVLCEQQHSQTQGPYCAPRSVGSGTGAGIGVPSAGISLARAPANLSFSLGPSATGTGTTPVASSPIFEEFKKDAALAALEEYIQVLRNKQEPLANHEGARSHDEMAMMDQEWEELDTLINELERTAELLR
jgi:hypothetical protein